LHPVNGVSMAEPLREIDFAETRLLAGHPLASPRQPSGADNPALGDVMVEPVELLKLADELSRRAEGKPEIAAQAVLAAHAALEATVNRLGGVEIQSFNYRARFLPKWHDVCQRVLGRQLEAAPDLERLQAVRDSVVGYRGAPERLDRRASTPPPEVPTDVANPGAARWAVETARRVIMEFHEAAGREVPAWALERTGHQGTGES